MAQGDLDSFKDDTRVPKTAQEAIGGYGPQINDVANAEAAASAGVIDAAYIDYDVALEAYAARPDIEDLDRRRARDFPEDFNDASFMRETGGAGGSSGV